MEIKKILLNFQFDTLSLKALELAKDLAKKYNSQLIIFHEIVDVYMMRKVAEGFGVPISPDLEEKSKLSAKTKIDNLVKDFKGDLKIIIEASGRIKDRLPVIFKEENPDLVILTEEYEYISKKLDRNTLIVK